MCSCRDRNVGTLCFECFRRQRQQVGIPLDHQASLPFERPLAAPTRSAGGPRTLTERQIAHRQTMLANMTRQGVRS